MTTCRLTGLYFPFTKGDVTNKQASVAAATTIAIGGAPAAPQQADLVFPTGPGPHPLVVGVSGGGWIGGSRASLGHWARYLAGHGLATASIDYRRADHDPAFPDNAEDVATALRYFQESGARLGVDPMRIGLMGVSAGAHLAALVTLSNAFDVPTPLAFVGIYGVYDLPAHWQADRPRNTAPGVDKTERMMGCTPVDAPGRYADASPIRHITSTKNLPVLLVWGRQDLDVSPEQSVAFAGALREAGFPVTTRELPDAAHLWFSQQDPAVAGTHSAQVAPDVVNFLTASLR